MCNLYVSTEYNKGLGLQEHKHANPNIVIYRKSLKSIVLLLHQIVTL